MFEIDSQPSEDLQGLPEAAVTTICPRVLINGLGVWPFRARSDLIDTAFRVKGLLVAVNAEKILGASTQMRDIINSSIGYADGIGAVWALRKKGFTGAVKIPGCELWLDIVRRERAGKTFYLVGGKRDVIVATVAKLQLEFPGIIIKNFRDGFIEGPADKRALLDDIRGKRPDVVFVAMGSPKQELLMKEMHELHPAVYQGLGGSFDVYVGAVERAPKWWVDHNLEWAYRLIKQPSRLRRQIHLLRFLALLLGNRL